MGDVKWSPALVTNQISVSAHVLRWTKEKKKQKEEDVKMGEERIKMDMKEEIKRQRYYDMIRSYGNKLSNKSNGLLFGRGSLFLYCSSALFLPENLLADCWFWIVEVKEDNNIIFPSALL